VTKRFYRFSCRSQISEYLDLLARFDLNKEMNEACVVSYIIFCEF
jgi:hypothetical protein